MCGRVTQFDRFAEIPQQLGLSVPLSPPRYNLAPTQPLITVRQVDGALRCEPLRWGFRASVNVSDKPQAAGPINARSETLEQLPSFRDATRSRRCLIPIDGFYEWHREGKLALPYYFERSQAGPLAIAGLWSPFLNPNGVREVSVCLITTTPNRDISPIHNRMPVVLTSEHWPLWLAERPLASAQLKQLTAPAPDGLLGVRRVGAEVNRVLSDHPRLLASVASASRQGDFLGDLLG